MKKCLVYVTSRQYFLDRRDKRRCDNNLNCGETPEGFELSRLKIVYVEKIIKEGIVEAIVKPQCYVKQRDRNKKKM